MKNKKGLFKNKYFLFWTRFFVEINAINAVVQLFYLKRGLNPSEIIYLGIAWSLATLIFEIPTGYLADLIGRKKTIILGVVINIIANLLMFIAFGFIPFAVITALLSFSFACFSGTDDALIYDTLREIGDKKSLLRISGKYLSSARASKIFTPFIGAVIAQNLSGFQFNILLSINAVSSFVALFTSLNLVEPNRHIDVSEKEAGVLRDSIAILKNNPNLFRIILNKTLVFIGDFVFWKIYQGILTDLGFSVLLLGILYFIFQSILTLVYWFPDKIKSRIGIMPILNMVPVIALFCTLLILWGQNRWIVYIASMGVLLLGSIRDPFFTEIVQNRLKSYNRATSTSIFNFFKSVLDIPILYFSGLLALSNVRNVLYISIILFVFVVIVLPIRRKYIS